MPKSGFKPPSPLLEVLGAVGAFLPSVDSELIDRNQIEVLIFPNIFIAIR
jgi:hypothetical protein